MAKEKRGRGKEIFGPDYSPLRRPARIPFVIKKSNVSQARKKLFSVFKLDLDHLDLMYFGKDESARTQVFINEVFLSSAGRCPKLAQTYDS